MGTEQAEAAETETITGRHEVRDGVALVTVEGEVDVDTAPKVRDWLEEAFTADQPAVVLDLTGVTFFASVGLAMLVEFHGRGETEKIELRTVAPTRAVAAPIFLTTLDKVIKLYPDVDSAVAGG
ncbi:STAS domain-containing protein [Umezawaea sp. NPDC059074]|uniref:STAS domain-containing protein n=1 Tax=Umezawaea sp. NPDC059074 TaxID=3346716 RepID=UPI00367F5479